MNDVQSQAELFGQFSVKPTIDSIVFSDGSVVGPDKSRTFDKLTLEDKAERDVAKEIIRLVESDKASAVAPFLEELSSIVVRGRWQDDTRDFYADRQRLIAETLKSQLQTRSISDLAGQMKSMLSTPIVTYRNKI